MSGAFGTILGDLHHSVLSIVVPLHLSPDEDRRLHIAW